MEVRVVVIAVLTVSYVSMSSGQGVSILVPYVSLSEMIVGVLRIIAQHRSRANTVQNALIRSPSSTWSEDKGRVISIASTKLLTRRGGEAERILCRPQAMTRDDTELE